ncbi:hypothetical protein E2C01_049817 [Portunus trituberculatus]|uniref:Uncharacterized protein n=1 Tax=Portunus trituberculatus TaxID=210409 RepID=A0A5B7GAH1_PORTR|nr:hypothetical protein [Portunus trituberculatus]
MEGVRKQTFCPTRREVAWDFSHHCSHCRTLHLDAFHHQPPLTHVQLPEDRLPEVFRCQKTLASPVNEERDKGHCSYDGAASFPPPTGHFRTLTHQRCKAVATQIVFHPSLPLPFLTSCRFNNVHEVLTLHYHLLDICFSGLVDFSMQEFLSFMLL